MTFALQQLPRTGRGVSSFQNRKAEVVSVLKAALSDQLTQLAVAPVPVQVLAPASPYAAHSARATNVELALDGVSDEIDAAYGRKSYFPRRLDLVDDLFQRNEIEQRLFKAGERRQAERASAKLVDGELRIERELPVRASRYGHWPRKPPSNERWWHTLRVRRGAALLPRNSLSG